MGHWAEFNGIYIDSPERGGQQIPVVSDQPRPLGDRETVVLYEARSAFPERRIKQRVLFQVTGDTGELLIQRIGQFPPPTASDISGDAEVKESEIPQYREVKDGEGRIIGGLIEEVRHLSSECVCINTGKNRFRGVWYVPDTSEQHHGLWVVPRTNSL